jgi:hypothetical protein
MRAIKMGRYPITYETLKAVDSCAQGLRWFKKKFPDGLTTMRKDVVRFVDEAFKVRKRFAEFNVGSSCIGNIARTQHVVDISYFILDALYGNDDQEYYWMDNLEDIIYGKRLATKVEIVSAIWKEMKVYGEAQTI